MTQSFFSNWKPNTDQSTKVINTDEISRKFEEAYGIEPGSIYISTILITNGKSNVNYGRHRPQSDRKQRQITVCDRLGSIGSIVEITMHIIYSTKCAAPKACNKEFANVIHARIEHHAPR
ncbi:unnamed protein product, partial [Rotaria sp. Silwood2]